jgi:hypothetical protein
MVNSGGIRAALPAPPIEGRQCDYQTLIADSHKSLQLRCLLTPRPDPAPAPHQADGPEQVALNHEAVDL